MDSINAEVLVIGGGPAGLSAAIAASERSNVAIIDDNPHLGGQIWRAEMGQRSSDAGRLIDLLDLGRVSITNNAQVFGSQSDGRLLAETPAGRLELRFDRLILATGARELFLPFPGWTSPNVLGAGGLQAMVKGGLKIAGKRIVIAGTGPLLLAVADHLNAKGAKIVLIAEQTSAAKIRRFARGLWRQPVKMVQAAALRARLVGVPYRTDSWVTAADDGKVDLMCKGLRRTIDCDYLACGFHLVPNLELADMLGCEIAAGVVHIDNFQQTSRSNILCAGESTGIAGVESSIVEGTIAGLAATGQMDAAQLHFPERDRARRFGELLNRTFALRNELKTLADPDTIVCRCEDVEFGRLTEFTSFRDAKLQTRCGMGACQGRICGAATEFLFGWERPNVRAPIFPVKMGNL